MKYVMVVGDGMADLPIEALGGKTPLSYLAPPALAVAGGGALGRLRSCPEQLPPGSDVAFLTLLGHDTARVYTGRAPLEAAGCGVALEAGEACFRMNLVALGEDEDGRQVILSHNGGGIDGQPAEQLVLSLMADPEFGRLMRQAQMRITPSRTFRHVAVMPASGEPFELDPPHDIIRQPLSEHLPRGQQHQLLRALTEAAHRALEEHPINQTRRQAGLLPANGVWFWGAGRPVQLDNFEEKYAKKGVVVSAVPLVKGIARLSGLSAPDLPGATGLLDTDYEGKVACALAALQAGSDFALVHLEAPDEMSHDGSLPDKMKAICRLDQRILAPLLEALPHLDPEFRLLVMPDHYTLLSTRTHDGTPVPYCLYDSRQPGVPRPFTEAGCEGQPVLESGDQLMRQLFEL